MSDESPIQPPAFEDDPFMQLLLEIGRREIFHPKKISDETDTRDAQLDVAGDTNVKKVRHDH